MRPKTTLYLLLIVAVLAAFAYFFEQNRPGTKEANSEAKRLVAVDRDDVTGLTVTDHDAKIDLVKEESRRWSMKTPVADRADQNLIDQVMTELDTASTDESFKVSDSDKSRLQEYGLQAPHTRLLVTRKDGKKPIELLFGNDTAIEGKTYVRVEGTDQVLITSAELKKLLQKDTNAWRDHRVVDLLATDVSRLTIKNASGEIELQRDGTHWKVAKPLAARGDDAKINDFVSQLTNLTITKFVADDKADAAAYGLAEPRATVTLYTADNAKGTEMMIGGTPAAPSPTPTPSPGASPAAPTPAPTPAAPVEGIYLRQPARQSIFLVSKGVEGIVTVKPNDVRDRALARINADTVDRIHIGNFTLVRKDKTWTRDDQPINAAGLATLINALNSAQVLNFVADSAAPADLSKYGLDQPAVQVKFGAFASENTAESTAGEKPVATVDFGKEEGGTVYARVEEEPFIVSVPRTVLDSVWTDPAQWQPLEIFHFEPEKIASLEVGLKGAPSLALTRGDKGEWKAAAGGTPVEATKVQTVLNVLSTLRAVRWVGGPALPTYALENPQATLSFAGGADDKANTGKMYFGGRNSEFMTYARVEGKPGVFLLNRQDAEVLLQFAPLPPEPVPTPAPVATPTPAPVATPTPAPPAPTPAAAPMPEPVPSTAPTPAATPTPAPAATPTPEPTPVATPMPVATPVATPTPTPAAPTPTPAESPAPTPVPTPTPAPTVEAIPPVAPMPATTPTPTPSPTAAPTPEATPAPSVEPTPTSPPVSTPADVPVPAPAP